MTKICPEKCVIRQLHGCGALTLTQTDTASESPSISGTTAVHMVCYCQNGIIGCVNVV